MTSHMDELDRYLADLLYVKLLTLFNGGRTNLEGHQCLHEWLWISSLFLQCLLNQIDYFRAPNGHYVVIEVA
jgi:hypothetical protein